MFSRNLFAFLPSCLCQLFVFLVQKSPFVYVSAEAVGRAVPLRMRMGQGCPCLCRNHGCVCYVAPFFFLSLCPSISSVNISSYSFLLQYYLCA